MPLTRCQRLFVALWTLLYYAYAPALVLLVRYGHQEESSNGVLFSLAQVLGEGAVLLLLLAELLLDLEGLLERLLMGRAVGERGQRRFHLLRLERSRP